MDALPDDISLKCRVHLEKPPECADLSGLRGYAVCWAQWIGMKEQKMDFGSALRQGWANAKRSCTP
jgi:hypothetical protein